MVVAVAVAVVVAVLVECAVSRGDERTDGGTTIRVDAPNQSWSLELLLTMTYFFMD